MSKWKKKKGEPNLHEKKVNGMTYMVYSDSLSKHWYFESEISVPDPIRADTLHEALSKADSLIAKAQGVTL